MKNYFLSLLIFLTQISLLSCQKNNKNIVDLNDINSFIKKIDGFDYTIIGLDSKNNNLVELKKNIVKGADINLAKTDGIYEYDAFYVAIENKNIEIVNYLLKCKININNIYTEEGLTALALAVKVNDENIVKTLIINGANVNSPAVAETDYKIIPILLAIENNNKKITKLLLENGADISVKNSFGQSIKTLISNKGNKWKELLELNIFNTK